MGFAQQEVESLRNLQKLIRNPTNNTKTNTNPPATMADNNKDKTKTRKEILLEKQVEKQAINQRNLQMVNTAFACLAATIRIDRDNRNISNNSIGAIVNIADSVDDDSFEDRFGYHEGAYRVKEKIKDNVIWIAKSKEEEQKEQVVIVRDALLDAIITQGQILGLPGFERFEDDLEYDEERSRSTASHILNEAINTHGILSEMKIPYNFNDETTMRIDLLRDDGARRGPG